MYEIGRFAVIGEHEPEPVGFLPIRLRPLNHHAAYPWWSETTQAMLRELPDLVTPGMRVLDFGCGATAILSLAVIALGAMPYPVEIHPEIAALAGEQLGEPPVPASPTLSAYDFALANVGDAALVGEVSRLAPHGLGTDKDGELVRW